MINAEVDPAGGVHRLSRRLQADDDRDLRRAPAAAADETRSARWRAGPDGDGLEPHAQPGSEPEHEQVEQGGSRHRDRERRPEADSGLQHGGKHQEHRHRGQEEPEGTLGELGNLSVLRVSLQTQMKVSRETSGSETISPPTPGHLRAISDAAATITPEISALIAR